MMNSTGYIIFVETATGEIIRAFTWMRDAQSGIEQAKLEATQRGIPFVRVFAQEVSTQREIA